MACLNLKTIIFCIVAGIIIGIAAAFIKDELTHKVHSMTALIIIGILFAYLGITCIYAKYGCTLFSVPAIAGGILAAIVGELNLLLERLSPEEDNFQFDPLPSGNAGRNN